MGKKKRKEIEDMALLEEGFYFVAGYTSSGMPFGMTWEEAYEAGLVEEDLSDEKIDDTDLPF